MATQKNTASSTKTTAAKKTGKSANKSTAAKSTAKKSNAKKSTSTTNVSAEQRKKNLERVAAANKRKNTFSQFVPFILFAFALILAVLLVLNAVSYFTSSQLEGVVGEFICRNILFGVFGHASYLFPVLLVVMGIFWFKAPDGVTRAIKAVLSVMIIIVFSAMVHIFMHEGWSADNMDTNFTKLFLDSTQQQAGGLLGGYLGFVCSWAFKIASPFVLLFILIILFFVLLDITPVQVWNKIKAAHARNAERARLAALEQEDEDDDYEEDEDEDEEYAAMSAKKNKKKGRDVEDELEDYLVDPVTGELVEVDKKAARKKKKQRAQEDDDDSSGFHPIKLTADELPDGETPSFAQRVEQPEISDQAARDDQQSDADPTAVETDAYAGEGELDRDQAMEEIEVDLEDDSIHTAASAHTRKKKQQDPELEEQEDMLDELLAQDDPADTVTQQDLEDVYVFPTTDMLAAGNSSYHTSEEEVAANTEVLRQTLEDFHIRVKEVTCSTGPTVTRYEIKPEAGVRVRAIANLVDDIALGLAKSGVRIEAPIPGKAAVGIEVPNDKPATVYLRNLLESPEFVNHKSKVAVCLGADVSGKPVVFDIEKMPHLLVAGATGMGKSVCINCLVMSLLYKARPDEVKLIMVDPKKVEFTMYRDIPHLYCPIVSDPKKAAGALASAVAEMERRFSLIEEVGVRNITGYNELTKDDPEKEYLPRIVIIIDELADLMMTAPDDVETCICRLAQKARAAGIHIIIGTQRPSVDVVTGLIKANIPSRIAFTVSSQVDSRTIIDVGGAEKLIGRGDMLYAPVGAAKPQRVQGAFVADGEVERVVTFVKTQNGSAKYNDSFTKRIEEEAAKCGTGGKKGSGGGDGELGGGDGEDEKLWEAVEVVVTEGKASTSMLQRYLKVGYGRAAGLLDRMEELGFISEQDGNKPRRVLVTKSDLDELRMNGKAD